MIDPPNQSSSNRSSNTNEKNAAASTGAIHYGATWNPQAVEISGEQKENVAVLVCHGMGQQVRYETISAVAQSIREEATRHGNTVGPVEVHLSQANDAFLVRAELSWTDKDAVIHCVHVYEAYWAPLTEGRVTYWDTIKFLFRAAADCLSFMNPGQKFKRWIFGGPKELPVNRWAFFYVLIAMLILVMQIGIATYVTLGLAQALTKFMAHPLPTGIATFSGTAWQTWWNSLASGSVPRMLVNLLLTIVVFYAMRWVRTLIVQYAGDVAAYISPYKDSKFDELRHKIQKVGLDVGKIIYGFGTSSGTPPQYQRVVILGHSLGSVLAYDTLNALINLDQTSEVGSQRDVLGRTPALITFGSPLDKTAFIFRMQARSNEDWIREQLAAAVQPLIVSYEDYRRSNFQWINIWSPLDIISGCLEYYDDPAVAPGDARHVQNMKDGQAKRPVHAHIEYWEHDLLRQQIYRFIGMS
jgi:hypothetical protein